MNGEYKITMPLEDTRTMPRMSPRGKHAVAWRRHWHNLVVICKSLRKSKIRYEVEFHFGAEIPYARLFAGGCLPAGAFDRCMKKGGTDELS